MTDTTTNMEQYRDKEVTCSDCGRSWICSAEDDIYECQDGLHRCMGCLVAFAGMPPGTRIVTMSPEDILEFEAPGE